MRHIYIYIYIHIYIISSNGIVHTLLPLIATCVPSLNTFNHDCRAACNAIARGRWMLTGTIQPIEVEWYICTFVNSGITGSGNGLWPARSQGSMWWLILTVDWTLGKTNQWHRNNNTTIGIQEHAVGNVIYKIAAILIRPQYGDIAEVVANDRTISWM